LLNLNVTDFNINMLNFFAGGLVAAVKFLSFVLFSKISLAVALMLWHQAISCNGAYRLCHLTRALPFLALELRTHLSFRHWLARLWQLAARTKDRGSLPAVASTNFLVCRDGHTIFDFFKTLSFSGISPPAIA
jgi:hypothetical protein